MDFLGKFTTPAHRAGQVIERVGKMAIAGVPDSAILAMINEGSSSGGTYTKEFVRGAQLLYRDCHTCVPVTKKQANAMISDATDYCNGVVVA